MLIIKMEPREASRNVCHSRDEIRLNTDEIDASPETNSGRINPVFFGVFVFFAGDPLRLSLFHRNNLNLLAHKIAEVSGCENGGACLHWGIESGRGTK